MKCGYLLPAEVDEKFLIKTNMMQGRYNKNLLSLTIAPTMACNFRCIYCFEKGHYGNSLMDGETQIALMNFIKSHLDGVKTLMLLGLVENLFWECLSSKACPNRL